jgi:hypothetical protein
MLAGFFFLPKPQKWSLLVTAMQKVTEKHLKIYCFREDSHKEGLMEALSKAGIFFVSFQSLLSTLKTLRYESK